MEETKNVTAVTEEKEEVKETENTAVAVVENVTDSDTPTGGYKHTFAKPFEYEGKTYKELTFDFEKLIGTDMIAIEDEMAAVGQYALSPEISTSFLSKMAARAAGVGSDVVEHLPLRDFGKIKNESRNFLISTGF